MRSCPCSITSMAATVPVIFAIVVRPALLRSNACCFNSFRRFSMASLRSSTDWEASISTSSSAWILTPVAPVVVAEHEK